MLARIALVLSAFVTLGCSSLRPPLTCPSKGGLAWHELSSAHFTMRTDLGEDEATQVIGAIEQTYTLFKVAAFPSDGDLHDQIDVVVFAREKDYRELAPSGAGAYFAPGAPNDVEPVPTVVMQGGLDEDKQRIFQHELTHLFVRQSFGATPPWFSEGLAEYYSTIKGANGYLYFGALRDDLHVALGGRWWYEHSAAVDRLWVPLYELPSPWALLAMGRGSFYVPGDDASRRRIANYMGAWGLVHLLHNGPPAFRKRYGALADLLRSGRPFRVAWQATFGDVSSRELEAAFRSHLSQARVPLLALPYTPPPAPSAPRVRAMTDAEAHLLWARLRPWEADAAAKANGDLAEARAEDAGSPEVRYWQALYALRVARDRSLAARLLEEALSARPSEPRYLLALALALDEDDGALRGSARLAGVVEDLARRAASAMQLEFLARHHARREHLDAARSFAERSVKADPTCAACLDTYAMVSFAKGDLAEAVYAEERAIAALPEQHVDRDMVARLEKYVQAYEAREKQESKPAEDRPRP